MHILRALSKYKIFVIKITKDSLYIFLVLNAFFITVYHVKAVQDDISAKTIPIWLHHTVYYRFSSIWILSRNLQKKLVYLLSENCIQVMNKKNIFLFVANNTINSNNNPYIVERQWIKLASHIWKLTVNRFINAFV